MFQFFLYPCKTISHRLIYDKYDVNEKHEIATLSGNKLFF